MKFKKIVALFSLLGLMCHPACAVTKFVKVAFVGDYQCGKTEVWHRVLGLPYSGADTSETFCDREQAVTVNGDTYVIHWLDTAGADRFYDGVIRYVSEADADIVLIVHDLSKKYDEAVKEYMNRIYGDIIHNLPRATIAFVGAKKDCKNLPFNVVLGQFGIVNFAKQKKMLDDVSDVAVGRPPYMTSALRNEGIAELRQFVIDTAVANRDRLRDHYVAPKVPIERKPTVKRYVKEYPWWDLFHLSDGSYREE